MTRMSSGRPRSMPAERKHPESRLLEATWRVESTRSLSVVVIGGDAASRVGVLVRIPDGAEFALSATVTAESSEWTLRAEGTDGLPSFELACIARTQGAPLIITDLPARIGLMGGTYELDRVVS